MDNRLDELGSESPFGTRSAAFVPAPGLARYAPAAAALAAAFTLQQFGAEEEGRTEDPTGRKLGKARQKGQVAKSTEVPTAALMLAGFFGLSLYLPYLWAESFALVRYYLSADALQALTEENVRVLLLQLVWFLLKATGPVLLGAFVIVLASTLAQVGFLFTLEPLKPNWGKISFTPKKMWERIVISKQTVANFFKSIFKVTVITWLTYSELAGQMGLILNTLHTGIMAGVATFLEISYRIGLKAALFLILIAAFDWWFQKHEHKEQLKMKKQEVKDEMKDMEGDPQIKRRIRDLQMRLLRMLQAVPEATVVITNPTHYAVALKYEPDQQLDAPVVIAKGENLLALRIRELAKQNDIPIYEDKPLARALYEEVEIGQLIPKKHFQAVAEVLSWVFRMKGPRRTPPAGNHRATAEAAATAA